jgi:Spy/CpxP family protein refolding chaperone
VTGRKRVQIGVVALAACLGAAVLTVGAGAVAAFEQKAVQTPQVQTPAAQTPTQGRGDNRGGGPGPGRPGPNGLDAPREWEWWKDDAAKRELGLTDKIAADIDSFYQRRQREIAPFVMEYLKQSEVLNQMSSERKVDEPTYAVQVSHVEALRTRLRESRTVMLYHIYLKLSPEQYKKLTEIRDRHFNRGRGGH